MVRRDAGGGGECFKKLPDRHAVAPFCLPAGRVRTVAAPLPANTRGVSAPASATPVCGSHHGPALRVPRD